ncbi:Epimerase family protein [Stieleria bergensis]|uniref:Epimerase family protein n=1 Tax=Stieleria bergensis TaxID=2528025 RepID=A0A517SSF7_9BACT|nr:Epimerase family protein [Planctomycetes bacterium SV_7m_r]
MKRYVAVSTMPVPIEQAFAYHDRPGAFERLIPPWKTVTVEHNDRSLQPDSQVTMRVHMGPLRPKWVARHTRLERPHHFQDIQQSGPFSHWQHDHRFEARGDKSLLIDDISYQAPLGKLGSLLSNRLINTELQTTFAYRHRVTADDLQLLERWGTEKKLRVAISGSTGLVGRNLCAMLRLLGHEVIAIKRTPVADGSTDEVNPWQSEQQAQRLNGIDAVIHLAGKSIADTRWSPSVKAAIRESRVDLTKQLADRLAKLQQPPSALLCASASGVYGHHADEEFTEDSVPGDDFLSDVAVQWEAACRSAAEAGIRVVNLRLGIVLDPRGGALSKMRLPAKLAGGALGGGKQWWSWIALDDVLGATYHAMMNEDVQGPVNLVSPNPIRQKDFANVLGKTIGIPALLPAPAFGLRLALGEMADYLLLASCRVRPTVLLNTNYEFRFAELDQALMYCLGYNRLSAQETT